MQTTLAKYGQRMRIVLWLVALIIPLCLLGAPLFLGLQISPLSDSNIWLGSGWILIDMFFMTPKAAQLSSMWLDYTPAHKAALAAVFSACSMLIIALFWQIDRLFKHYATGKVFSLESAVRFKYIGRLLLLFFVINAAGGLFLDYMLAPPVEEVIHPDSLGLFVVLDFGVLLAGLFMTLVAKVMILGVRLQEDVDATI